MLALPRQRWLGSPWVVTLGVLSLAFAVLGLGTEGTNWVLVGVAALFAASLVGLGWSLGRSSLPLAVLLILPIGCDLVITALRQAQGGSSSGYSPLTILPIVWVGLAFGRRAVGLITLVTAAMFALPILLIGPPMYPDSGWRGVVLWVIVAFVVGTGARRVMASQRHQTALATSRAAQLDRLVSTQNRIATARFEVNATLDTVGRAGADADRGGGSGGRAAGRRRDGVHRRRRRRGGPHRHPGPTGGLDLRARAGDQPDAALPRQREGSAGRPGRDGRGRRAVDDRGPARPRRTRRPASSRCMQAGSAPSTNTRPRCSSCWRA